MKRVGFDGLERSGRLGNQLWQIASTLGLARIVGVDPIFPESWSYRRWFSLPDHWYGDTREVAQARNVARFVDLPPGQRTYMQQWDFIRRDMDEIQAVFAPSRDACELVIDHLRDTGQTYLLEMTDAITLHIRRGDNTDPESHPVGSWPLVTSTYYRKALEVLDPDGTLPVVVFSDDPEWCRDNLGEFCGEWNPTIVTDGPIRSPDYEPAAYAADPAMDWIDLQLMAMFSRHIIANSTYSLWGALLGPGPTVYPNNWVGWRCRASLPEESTMVPPEWVMVDNPVDPEHLNPC